MKPKGERRWTAALSLDLRTVDLGRLNSLTKYPSIPTYHALDPSNGGLLEEPTRFPGEVLLTEKVDGTNARVVCMPGHSFVIGSRGEFLLARGDLIGNPAMGIADRGPHLLRRGLRRARDPGSSRGASTGQSSPSCGSRTTGVH